MSFRGSNAKQTTTATPEQQYKVGVYVDELTTTNSDIVDMKKLKELCVLMGNSCDLMKFLHTRLMHQLEQQHAEIRYGALLVINELFMRSAAFRSLHLAVFEEFMDLTVGSDPSKPLPKPPAVAKKLKVRTLQCIQKWNQAVPKNEKPAMLKAYNYVKKTLKIDFEDEEMRTAAELTKVREEEERAQRFTENFLTRVEADIESKADDANGILSEMENGFKLVIPKPENFLHECEEDDENKEDSSNWDPRDHGLTTAADIQIQIDRPAHINLTKTEDNEDILHKLKENYLYCKNNLIPFYKKVIRHLNERERVHVRGEALIRQSLDMQGKIECQLAKYEELYIQTPQSDTGAAGDSESDSDSDFEDVPDLNASERTHGNSVNRKSSITSESGKEFPTISSRKRPKTNDHEDPTTAQANILNLIKLTKPTATVTSETLLQDLSLPNDLFNVHKEESNFPQAGSSKTPVADGPSTSAELSRKEKLLKAAPKLPFDIDLFHWEDKDLKAPSVQLGEGSSHRFWQPQDREGEVIEAQDGVAALRTRKIEFTGNFEPIKWSCRAPMKSGKLCPRKDRVNCPFHGKIIPRDETGIPTNPEDIVALEKKKAKEEAEKPPEWQDPEYLKELKAQIGIDLTIKPPKKGRKRKTFAESYPRLTDIDKEKKNPSPRTRLYKKIFNRKSVNNVADDLDSQTYKRHRDKFGDQWNYSMNDD